MKKYLSPSFRFISVSVCDVIQASGTPATTGVATTAPFTTVAPVTSTAPGSTAPASTAAPSTTAAAATDYDNVISAKEWMF